MSETASSAPVQKRRRRNAASGKHSNNSIFSDSADRDGEAMLASAVVEGNETASRLCAILTRDYVPLFSDREPPQPLRMPLLEWPRTIRDERGRVKHPVSSSRSGKSTRYSSPLDMNREHSCALCGVAVRSSDDFRILVTPFLRLALQVVCVSCVHQNFSSQSKAALQTQPAPP
jgi:hypothetical protein